MWLSVIDDVHSYGDAPDCALVSIFGQLDTPDWTQSRLQYEYNIQKRKMHGFSRKSTLKRDSRDDKSATKTQRNNGRSNKPQTGWHGVKNKRIYFALNGTREIQKNDERHFAFTHSLGGPRAVENAVRHICVARCVFGRTMSELLPCITEVQNHVCLLY